MPKVKKEAKFIERRNCNCNDCMDGLKDAFATLDNIIKAQESFSDRISLISERVDLVNSNGQGAWDKIEQMEVKLRQVAGRLGL